MGTHQALTIHPSLLTMRMEAPLHIPNVRRDYIKNCRVPLPLAMNSYRGLADMEFKTSIHEMLSVSTQTPVLATVRGRRKSQYRVANE